MSNITFDKQAKAKIKKEDIEWLRIWCEETNDESLPHVALIGDSITEGYYSIVKEELKGIANLDYFATSYSVVSELYSATVKSFIKDSAYAVVHYNYGLHAYGVDAETYQVCCKELLQFIASQTRTVIATTTTVLDETLKAENVLWKDKVIARNKKLLAIAKELDLDVDDLNTLCKGFDTSFINQDGVHFNEAGYFALSKSVAESIKKQLEKG